MFKRMSILLRRPEDSRAVFANKWENHGNLVKALPLIRSYMQNHVIETFDDAQPIEADGIVELRFDKPEDMMTAFSSPAAGPVRADEPGFLGHGTGYALSSDAPLLPAPDGSKLVLIIGNSSQNALNSVLQKLRDSKGCAALERDDVASVIARPEMTRGPQQVSVFLQIKCSDPEFASAIASALSAELKTELADLKAAIFRVRTLTVI